MNIIRNGTGKAWMTEEEIDAGIPTTKDGFTAERHLYKIMQAELPETWTILYDRTYPGEGGRRLISSLLCQGKV